MNGHPSPALHLERSPLMLVLAQVRFSPILQMESFVPAIQEDLRRAGYPGYRESTAHQIVFPSDGEIAARSERRWLFLDRDEREAVVLAPDFAVLQTSRYETFAAFADALERSLDVIGSSAEIDSSERIGLRYVNRIVPGETEHLRDYLRPGLASLSAADLTNERLRVEPTQTACQIRTQTAAGGTLVLRISERPPNDTELPPGLDDEDMLIDRGAVDRYTMMLDIDHFMMRKAPFDVAEIMKTVGDLHDYIELAFTRSTSEHAMEAWGRRNG